MSQRRLRLVSGLFGLLLLALAAGVVAVVGGSLASRPVVIAQVVLVGLAGACDLLSATNNGLTAKLGWYRWQGLGNVLLGFALPLGGLASASGGVFLGLTVLGGLSLVAMGVDMLAFDGRYMFRERLTAEG